ncbi:NAD(P)-binding oxidoreductase [Fodinicola acaciae]|uniref:NAD(P)-binding oxidoreductase n=1 Tax=Fodinicola acaciae TaxID=2681555 RepID=UPI0013D6DE86|nr:NAD(P)-binding oxidoreductase [Fodinicola acaciae]
MRVVIAGGHGQIALRLEALLAGRGDEAVGLIRNPDHTADLQKRGATSVVLDLENSTVDQLADVLTDADAVVFAAGAGPGSGAARKDTVDRDAAILLADAAESAGVRRYVMVSAYGADNYDPDSTEVFQIYLRAKAQADADLRGRELDWTVVRPGSLTDDPGTGQVTIDESVPRGRITRDDVAALLLHILDNPCTASMQFEVVGGSTPIADALATFAREH